MERGDSITRTIIQPNGRDGQACWFTVHDKAAPDWM